MGAGFLAFGGWQFQRRQTMKMFLVSQIDQPDVARERPSSTEPRINVDGPFEIG